MTAARHVLIAFALCAALLGAACARRTTAFVMVLEASPKTLDPIRGTDAASERLRQLMFNSLLRKDEHFDYVPELAERAEAAPDGLSMTFTLRDNVKFHNGKPLTAADVKYTFDKLLASDSPKAASFYEGTGAARQPLVMGVDAPDARTVVFRLRRPWLELKANMIPIPVIPEGTFETLGRQPVGTGPYKFVSWNEAAQVVDMTAFDDYWEGAPNVKQLRVRVILDANTQQAELRAGRVDLAVNTALTPDAYVALTKDPNLQIVQSPGANVQWLGFNTQSAPLNDARVRQAIAYAINREDIIKNLLQDQARIAHSMIPPESWAYAPGTVYNYDPAKAKQLLDEAGLKDPDGDGPRQRLAKPLSFKISASNVVVRNYAGVIQNQLQAVGLPAAIETLEDNTLREAQNNGQFQLTAGRWVGGNQDPIFLRDLFTFLTGKDNYRFNRVRYSNPEVDKLLGEAVATADRARARTLYAQAQEIISRDMPALPLWYANNIVIARKTVGNIQVPPSADWTFVRTLTVAQQ
ncbi:MAG TPA: ABC transporter substrate-binding protein [Pyrinomonadaceae bacterium]|jgi:peptide/nickel transport system substrate-binding protein